MNKLSIIILALNEEKFLPSLLTSLTKQTNMDFEVVVVDGVSTDATVAVAQSFESKLPNLTVIVSEKAGVSRQRNRGAQITTGDWLVFIDADSILLPYFVERINAFIQEQNPKFFTAWFRPESEVSSDALLTLATNSFVEGGLIFHRAFAPGGMTAVRRDIFDLAGGFNETISFGEDYELTRRIGDMGIPLQVLRETLSIYSFRRLRREGKLRFIGVYARTSMQVLLTKQPPKKVKYVTGGQLYEPQGSSKA